MDRQQSVQPKSTKTSSSTPMRCSKECSSTKPRSKRPKNTAPSSHHSTPQSPKQPPLPRPPSSPLKSSRSNGKRSWTNYQKTREQQKRPLSEPTCKPKQTLRETSRRFGMPRERRGKCDERRAKQRFLTRLLRCSTGVNENGMML